MLFFELPVFEMNGKLSRCLDGLFEGAIHFGYCTANEAIERTAGRWNVCSLGGRYCAEYTTEDFPLNPNAERFFELAVDEAFLAVRQDLSIAGQPKRNLPQSGWCCGIGNSSCHKGNKGSDAADIVEMH